MKHHAADAHELPSVYEARAPELIDDIIPVIQRAGRPMHPTSIYATADPVANSEIGNRAAFDEHGAMVRRGRADDIEWFRRRTVSRNYDRMIKDLATETGQDVTGDGAFLLPSLIDVLEYEIIRGNVDRILELTAHVISDYTTRFGASAVMKEAYPLLTEEMIEESRRVTPSTAYLRAMLCRNRQRLALAAGMSPLMTLDFMIFIAEGLRPTTEDEIEQEKNEHYQRPRTLEFCYMELFGAYFIATLKHQPVLLTQRVARIARLFPDPDKKWICRLYTGLVAALMKSDDLETFKLAVAPHMRGSDIWYMVLERGPYTFMFQHASDRFIKHLSKKKVPQELRENAGLCRRRSGAITLSMFNENAATIVEYIRNDVNAIYILCTSHLFGFLKPTPALVVVLHRLLRQTHEIGSSLMLTAIKSVHHWLMSAGQPWHTVHFTPQGFQNETPDTSEASKERHLALATENYINSLPAWNFEFRDFLIGNMWPWSHFIDWRGADITFTADEIRFLGVEGVEFMFEATMLPMSFYCVAMLANPLYLPSFKIRLSAADVARFCARNERTRNRFQTSLLLSFAVMSADRATGQHFLARYIEDRDVHPIAFLTAFEYVHGRRATVDYVCSKVLPQPNLAVPDVSEPYVGDFLKVLKQLVNGPFGSRPVSFQEYVDLLDAHPNALCHVARLVVQLTNAPELMSRAPRVLTAEPLASIWSLVVGLFKRVVSKTVARRRLCLLVVEGAAFNVTDDNYLPHNRLRNWIEDLLMAYLMATRIYKLNYDRLWLEISDTLGVEYAYVVALYAEISKHLYRGQKNISIADFLRMPQPIAFTSDLPEVAIQLPEKIKLSAAAIFDEEKDLATPIRL